MQQRERGCWSLQMGGGCSCGACPECGYPEPNECLVCGMMIERGDNLCEQCEDAADEHRRTMQEAS